MASKRISTYTVIQPAADTSALGVDSTDSTVLLDMSDVALSADVSAAVAAAAAPPGVLQAYAGSTAPSGWLLCDGTAVSRSTYSNLFDAIGTLWGVGDGSTTFNLPDGRGAVLRGSGTGTVNARDKVGPAVGDKQEDQMQRITGDSGWGIRTTSGTASGAISLGSNTVDISASSGTNTSNFLFNSADSPDARASATTDGETRAYGIGVHFIIKT